MDLVDALPESSHRRRRWAIAVVFFVLYVYSFPYFDRLRSAHELPRIFMTTEIVDHATFAIDRRVPELGSQFDVARPPGGHAYSNKAPGLSFAAVPIYCVVKVVAGLAGGTPSLAVLTWAFRVGTVTLATALFLPCFYGFCRRYTDDPAARRLALIAYGAGSMAMPYSMLFFSHQLASVLLALAFIVAVRLAAGDFGRRSLAALAVGMLLGAATITEYPAVIGAAAIGVYLVIRSRHALHDALWALAGAAPFVALLGWYHFDCFGSPLTTGYAFSADRYQRQGLLGLVGPSSAAAWQALLGPRGLLVLSPWVAFAPIGAIAIVARKRCDAETIAIVAIATIYILYLVSLSPHVGHGGWSVGPRYVTVALPFLAWLASAGFAAAKESTFFRVLARTTVFLSVAIYVLASATYPHWPLAFSNPLYEVSLRVVREGLAPHSLGTLAGLAGVPAYLPLFVSAGLLTALATGLGSRRSRLETLVAAALAGAVFCSYGYFPKSDTSGEAQWRWIRSTWEPTP